jgi:hypothetical protein
MDERGGQKNGRVSDLRVYGSAADLYATHRIIQTHGRDWDRVTEALERPKRECINRYEKCVEHKDTRRQGIYFFLNL